MKALTRMIRSLFGLSKSSTDDTETGSDEGDVTVEREAVDTETEAAVKGTGETDESAETEEDLEAEAEPEIEEADVEPEIEEAEAEPAAEEDETETATEAEEAEEAEEEGEVAEEEVEEVEEVETEAEEPEAEAVDEEPETESEPDTEEEPDAEEAEAEAEAGDDVSVEEINGIGPTYSERLAQAGLGTIVALADSDPATVAEASQASESRAEEWIEQAADWD